MSSHGRAMSSNEWLLCAPPRRRILPRPFLQTASHGESKMSAAVFGLIGVVVGALLGGVVNLVVERSRRRSVALASGQVLDYEIKNAIDQIQSAVATKTWWLGDLPS